MTEKTILQDFLEKRPDIKDPARIVDRFCPEQAGYDPVYNKDCHKWTCIECWNRPVTSQKAFRDLQKMRELIARAEAAEKKIKQLTPCDRCAYDPPSSGDGKPCSFCPASKKED